MGIPNTKKTKEVKAWVLNLRIKLLGLERLTGN